MKNIARLALLFTVSFAGIFVLTVLVRFLHIRIDVIRALPPQDSYIGEELLAAARWALPTSLYSSLLFNLSYTVRRRIFAPAAMLCLFLFGSAACVGVITGVEGFSQLATPRIPAMTLGNPGMILTQGANTIVLIQDPGEPWGSRVVSLPGRPLLYQEFPRGLDNKPISLPPVPFRTGTAWAFRSLIVDFSLAGRQMLGRFASPGTGSLLIYSCALVFFLVSLRFVLALSNWPLANLFLGALLFRGVLALEIFLNTQEVQDILESFLGELIPPPYISPLVFVFLGFLVCLYSFLSYLARRKGFA
jgi:hypothetical protein